MPSGLWRGLIRALAVLGAATMLTSAEASDLNYTRLRESLMRGGLPVFVVDFAKCKGDDGAAGPPFTVLPGFRVYNLAADDIATSDTHLFEAKDGTMTLQYVRARFYPSDAVELTLKRLDPASYRPVSAATTYRYSLRDGSVRMRVQGLAEVLPLHWEDGNTLPLPGTTGTGKDKPESRD